MTTNLITPPSALPIVMADARLALKIEDTSLDNIIAIWLNGIIDYAEHYMQRSIMTQTWQKCVDGFDRTAIRLPYSPVKSVTSIKYLDANDTLQTVAPSSYWTKLGDLESFVVTKAGWPTTSAAPNSVIIEYVAGYGVLPADVPPAIKNYILAKLIEQFDPSNKTEKASVQSSFIDSLLDRYRVYA